MNLFTELGTIGLEEEFFAVDLETLKPAPASDVLLENPPEELKNHIDTELFKFVLETNIEKSRSLSEVKDQMLKKRKSLKEHANSYGYEILAAGLHPTAQWDKEQHIDKPRYKEQLERIRYPQYRNITAGLHVHVGVDDPDKAVWVSDEMRVFIPMLLALSSNSPFWYGKKTGLMSTRAVIFENLPNTGIPTELGSWSAFQNLESRMLDEGFIKDRGEIWWDVRPHSEYGTVEVRIPDSQTSSERSFAFISLIYSLVLKLCSLYEKGKNRTNIRREILDQNKWVAARYGKDANFLLPNSGKIAVEKMLMRVLSYIDMDIEVDPLFEKTGSERQIDIHNKRDFEHVLDYLRI